MLVPVTQKHIDNGIASDARFCMVAKAIRAKMKKKADIQVCDSEIEINGNLYYNTQALSYKIAAFDRNPKRVKPFTLKLNKERGTAAVVR